MANGNKDSLANRTSDKKHGALYREDTPHVESQDRNSETQNTPNTKSSNEEE